MKKRFLHILFALLPIVIVAQQKLDGQYFIKDKDLYIRWAPIKESNWTDLCKAGFDVYRISWSSNSLPDSLAFKGSAKLNQQPLSALTENDPAWAEIAKNTEEALFVKSVLYSKTTSANKNTKEYIHGICMLSADFYTPLASAMGLYFKTSVAADNGSYAYMIRSRAKQKVMPYIFSCNHNQENKLPAITTLSLQNNKKQIKLKWETKNLRDSYTGYHIERSEDGLNYIRVNKKPHIVITTETDKNKTEITYIDSTAKPMINYYYRVCGISFFGFNGEASNVVKTSVVKPIEFFVSPDSCIVGKEAKITVYTHLFGASSLDDLSGAELLRAESDSGKYSVIKKTNITSLSFSLVDDTPLLSNYYRIRLSNKSGDTLVSHSIMGILPDTKPPLPPTGLSGKIDSTGKVSITWQKNTEPDLKAYRIFRCNDLKEEFVDITNTFLIDNMCNDTVSMNTLNEEVYYAVIAVDKAYNKSPYSAPLKVKRPDKIKPQEALCKTIYHNDTAIIVKWIPSMSKDVSKYVLYRNGPDMTKEKMREYTPTDSLVYYDISIGYDKYYTYAMLTEDDDGNQSVSFSPKHFYTSRLRKPITDIEYTINKEKRSITLNWKYNPSQIENFVVYKAKKGEAPRIFKTVKANINQLEDKELYIGNTYIYLIKANYSSGAESKLSKEVQIEF